MKAHLYNIYFQHHTWNPKHMESERMYTETNNYSCFACISFGEISPAEEAFILVSKDREHILEMSATSLETKGSSDYVRCNGNV